MWKRKLCPRCVPDNYSHYPDLLYRSVWSRDLSGVDASPSAESDDPQSGLVRGDVSGSVLLTGVIADPLPPTRFGQRPGCRSRSTFAVADRAAAPGSGRGRRAGSGHCRPSCYCRAGGRVKSAPARRERRHWKGALRRWSRPSPRVRRSVFLKDAEPQAGCHSLHA